MSVYTEFWKLKSILVGDVQNYNLEKLDATFKIAYGENLKDSPFEYFKNYKVDKQKILERKEDLENLASLLQERWITVYRPEELKSFKTFKTPGFSWVLTPYTNPRDRVLVYGDKIIETPATCTKRYFENNLVYTLFSKLVSQKNLTWLSAPYPLLDMERIDDLYWKEKRDFENFDRSAYDMMFDAANMIKVWKDILFNISTYNQYIWYEWLQKILGEDVNIHPIFQLDDSHIDGKLSVLRPGTFLVNNTLMEKNIQEYLPEKFKDWEIIYTGDYGEHTQLEWEEGMDITYPELCSMRWHDTNVLSLDENTVLVQKFATQTIQNLEEKGFTVIPVQMRHPEIFWGGIHCATLDIEREDACIDYTLV